MTRDEWIAHGIEQGYCLAMRCVYHDGTEEAPDQLEQDDPCVMILQLLDS
jgi:hypothetical protein